MQIRSINNEVYFELLEKSLKSSSLYTKETYKLFLKGFISKLSELSYLDRNNNSVNIHCFHANQERAIAKLNAGNNITLPVISISETNTANNDKRRKYDPILLNKVVWDKDKNRALRILSLSPRAVDIEYSINIWAKYKQDLDQIRESIFLLFNPDLIINTKLTPGKAFINTETPVTNIEADDTEDRILKKTINIKLETYIPNPEFLYTSTGKIEELIIDIENIEDK